MTWTPWNATPSTGLKIQLGIMALLPRALLGLACTAFALHKERFLQLVMKEDQFVTQATQGHRSLLGGLLDSFARHASTQRQFGYGDMENPSHDSTTSSENFSLHSSQTLEDLQSLNREDVALDATEEYSRHELVVLEQAPTEDTHSKILVEPSQEGCVAEIARNELTMFTQTPTADALTNVRVEASVEKYVANPYGDDEIQCAQNERRHHDIKSLLSWPETSPENPALQSCKELQATKEESTGVGGTLDLQTMNQERMEMGGALDLQTVSPEHTEMSSESLIEWPSSKGVESCPGSTAAMTSKLPIVRSLHKWTVRNSFIEVELPETSEICDGKKDAWTDERADIEYQTYPHLVLSSFVSRMPSP